MSDLENNKPIEILLVEDNPGDVRLTFETLKDCKLTNKLHVVADGVEAMTFLRQEGKYADAKKPDLILLDLNLPRKDGRELLAEIKNDPAMKDIPVMIMTVSKAEQDVLRAQHLQATDYLTKPIDIDQFIWAMRFVNDFWFTIVRRKSDK